MLNRVVIIGAATVLSVFAAMAQEAAPINSFGTVEKVDAAGLVIKTEAGASETFALAPKILVLQNKAATLSDIKPNDYVASAAELKEDGKLHSTELRIFPNALRGLGEGQRPMNDARNQTMTNAVVTGAAVSNGSNHITVHLSSGKDSELVLDPGVPVTRIDEVDSSLVKAGAKVRVQGTRTGSNAVVNRVTIQ